MITCRSAYVASQNAKAKERATAAANFRVARQQKNGKLSAPNYRYDFFATRDEAERMAAKRMEWNPGAVFVVVEM